MRNDEKSLSDSFLLWRTWLPNSETWVMCMLRLCRIKFHDAHSPLSLRAGRSLVTKGPLSLLPSGGSGAGVMLVGTRRLELTKARTSALGPPSSCPWKPFLHLHRRLRQILSPSHRAGPRQGNFVVKITEGGGKYVISLSSTSTYALALPPMPSEEIEVPIRRRRNTPAFHPSSLLPCPVSHWGMSEVHSRRSSLQRRRLSCSSEP